jgi:hypothetical protein
LLGLSFFFSGSVHPRISEDASHFSAGSSKASRSFGAKVLDSLSRGLIITQCFAISFLLYRIPLIGWLLSFAYNCVIDSYWCFEYVWNGKGWDFKERSRLCVRLGRQSSQSDLLQSGGALAILRRLRYASLSSSDWSNGQAGLPVTLISFFSNSPLINLALFSVSYPLNLLLASSARPVPAAKSTSNDLPPISSTGMTSNQAPFHPLWPTRMPVLWVARHLHGTVRNLADARD